MASLEILENNCWINQAWKSVIYMTCKYHNNTSSINI